MSMPRHAQFPANEAETVTLLALGSAVPLGRRLVAEVGRRWRIPSTAAEDHQLVLSELLTNAINATRSFNQEHGIRDPGRVKFKLRWRFPCLITAVWDINPLIPVRRAPSLMATNGRGLDIIEYFCERWNALPCREGGKLVWAEQIISE